MDSIYPEPLSRLHRRAIKKKIRQGHGARYKTQPVTFAEIQEVDEETVSDELGNKSLDSSTKSELDLKAKFEEFKRQMNKDLKEPRPFSKNSDGENRTEDEENCSDCVHNGTGSKVEARKITRFDKNLSSASAAVAKPLEHSRLA